MKITLTSLLLVTLFALVGCVQEEASRSDQPSPAHRSTSNGAQF